MFFLVKPQIRTKAFIEDKTTEQVLQFRYLGHDIFNDKDHETK